MSAEDIKAVYDSFVENGDLKTMFPHLSGNWSTDEKTFTREYNRNEGSLEDFLDDEDEEDLY